MYRFFVILLYSFKIFIFFSSIFTWTFELNNIISVEKKDHRRQFSWFCFLVTFYNYWPKRIFHSVLLGHMFLDCVVLTRFFLLLYICLKVPIINLIFTVACLNNNCKVYVTGVVFFVLSCFKGLWHFIMHFMSSK